MVNATVKWVIASLIVSISIGVLVWFFIRLYSTNKNEPIPPIRRLSRPRFSIQETSLSQFVTYSPIHPSPSPSPIGFKDAVDMPPQPSRRTPYKHLRPEINLGLDLTETDEDLPPPNPLPEPTKCSHSLDQIAQETPNRRILVKPYPLKRQATFPLSDECQVPYAPFGRRTSYSSPSGEPYPVEGSAFYPPINHDPSNLPSAPPAGGSCSSLPPPPSYQDALKRKL